MVLITIHCEMLTSVSHVWKENTSEENFPPMEASGKVNCWGWCIVMCVER